MSGGSAGSGGAAPASGGYSHGEGTAAPDRTLEAGEPGTREASSTDLTDEVRRDDIYGGRAEIAGREDAVEGADEDAAG